MMTNTYEVTTEDPMASAAPGLPAMSVWALRLAGLAALVNGGGFGAFDIPGTWHLAHDHEVWQADGNPTYGNGPFEAHGISVTVPVLLAFLGSCVVLAIGGVLLLVPRPTGVVVTVAGILGSAPFWWGFDLPFAWFSAANILVLLAMAWAIARMHTRAGPASRPRPDPGALRVSEARVVATTGAGPDEPRALQRAGWAGAGAVVLLVAGVALCTPAGDDQPSASDATILAGLDGASRVAAGIGLPMVGVGVALLLWFASGLRRVLDRLGGGDPLAQAIVPAAALLGGLVIAGVSLDVSSAYTAWSDEFTPDPDTARVLGTAGLLVAFTGLAGGAVLVAVTTRIVQQARALPTWAVWASYVVAVLCLTGFWSGGGASAAFGLWLVGAVVGVLRSSTATGRR